VGAFTDTARHPSRAGLEVGPPAGAKLRGAMAEPLYLAADIGGTKTSCTVATEAGEILAAARAPTPVAEGPEACLGIIGRLLRQAAGEAGVPPEGCRAIGAAIGGPLDSRRGIIYSPPNLPNWEAVPLKDHLEAEFGLPAHTENDANAGALAEARFGAGRGAQNVVYLTLGTGIGGGIIADGRLYRGTTDDAGEIGHTTVLPGGPPCGCGKRGCLEALVAGPAIGRRAREKARAQPDSLLWEGAGGDESAIGGETALHAAQRGDAAALEVWAETAEYLGLGIANLVQVLNPQVVALGTIAIAAGDLLLEPVRAVVRREAWPRAVEAVRIVPAELGERVGDLAALCCALNEGR